MLRAVIFDMDGVICDSEHHHMRAFQEVLHALGLVVTDQDYYDKYLAFDDRGCFQAVFRAAGRPAPEGKALQDLLDKKARAFDTLMKEHVVIYPGVENFVKKLADKYPLALASGARRLEVEFVLKKAKIRGLFTAVVSADDVERGKPHPESFQKALHIINERRLIDTPEIKPSECLVIEDSVYGLAAAKAAGMKGAGVTTSFKADQLKDAAVIIESFVGYEIGNLEKLFV
jgi:HAD superfamily hydrolase (TIGR01509 family)